VKNEKDLMRKNEVNSVVSKVDKNVMGSVFGTAAHSWLYVSS
jgi:hypothetical protein